MGGRGEWLYGGEGGKGGMGEWLYGGKGGMAIWRMRGRKIGPSCGRG